MVPVGRRGGFRGGRDFQGGGRGRRIRRSRHQERGRRGWGRKRGPKVPRDPRTLTGPGNTALGIPVLAPRRGGGPGEGRLRQAGRDLLARTPDLGDLFGRAFEFFTDLVDPQVAGALLGALALALTFLLMGLGEPLGSWHAPAILASLAGAGWLLPGEGGEEDATPRLPGRGPRRSARRRRREESRGIRFVGEATKEPAARVPVEEPYALEVLEAGPAEGDVVCPFCACALEGAVVRCRRCETPHHRDCWREAKGCTTYACGEKKFRSVEEA